MKLALLIANRGFFPSSVISSARAEMTAAFARSGVEALYPDISGTGCGAYYGDRARQLTQVLKKKNAGPPRHLLSD